jgi:polyhydroxyalkanoate synthesis repressor PhaR
MPNDEPILIKRYANRKLYDQGRSRYVTLEELEELIRQGREIRVVDAVSGEDLTSQTLAQIILDTARGRRSALPVAFLHQLIQHGTAWQAFVQESLQSGLAGIVASQREAERALRDWGAQAGWWPSDHESGTAKPAASSEPSDAAGLKAEVAALREKLRELESRLGS